MQEGDEPQSEHSPWEWEDDAPPREPFWLAPEPKDPEGPALERLAGLAEQASSAAYRAAAEAKAQLEAGTQASTAAPDRAELLHSAGASLTRIARDAHAVARRLRRSAEPASTEVSEERVEPEPSSAGARVLARQLAADGHSPEEIEARLTREFGVSDSKAVVEELLRPR